MRSTFNTTCPFTRSPMMHGERVVVILATDVMRRVGRNNLILPLGSAMTTRHLYDRLANLGTARWPELFRGDQIRLLRGSMSNSGWIAGVERPENIIAEDVPVEDIVTFAAFIPAHVFETITDTKLDRLSDEEFAMAACRLIQFAYHARVELLQAGPTDFYTTMEGWLQNSEIIRSLMERRAEIFSDAYEDGDVDDRDEDDEEDGDYDEEEEPEDFL